MANFKDSYRLERVYFEKLKSMISILKSFLDNETDEKTRAILANEIDDNGAILLLYRNLGEAWAELADLIQKLRNDLNDLDEKEEAYHDELNERIDEVNNYLMALIRALEARMDAVEADLAQMGRLFTYDLAETSGVYSLTESGTAVTFADTVSKLTHVRPHFVSVRNGSKYYLIDTYDLTAGTGSVTWSGFEFTPSGEIKETIVTLAADNSVTVTQTSTNFAAILSRLTAIETKITNFGDLPSNANAEAGDVLMVGNNHLNVWGKAAGVIYLDFYSENVLSPSLHTEYTLKKDNVILTSKQIADLIASNSEIKVIVHQVNSYTHRDFPKILSYSGEKEFEVDDDTQTYYVFELNEQGPVHEDDEQYFISYGSYRLEVYYTSDNEAPELLFNFTNYHGFDIVLLAHEDQQPDPADPVELTVLSAPSLSDIMTNDLYIDVSLFSGYLNVPLSVPDIPGEIRFRKFYIDYIEDFKQYTNIDDETVLYYTIMFTDLGTTISWNVRWEYNTVTHEEGFYIGGSI